MSSLFSLLVMAITLNILSFIGFIADAPRYLIKYVVLASFVSAVSTWISLKMFEWWGE